MTKSYIYCANCGEQMSDASKWICDECLHGGDGVIGGQGRTPDDLRFAAGMLNGVVLGAIVWAIAMIVFAIIK